MADYTTIDNPAKHFNTVLYTGDGNAGRTVTGVGFQPQWLWIKERSSTSTHSLTDIIRGANERLQSSTTDAEFDTGTDNVRSFDSDGFTLGTGGQVNENSQTYVSWNWLAGGSASSNSDGDITSSVSVNTTAGFSIATYTGNNTNAQTIGHGLGVAPKVYIIKRRDSTSAWGLYHGNLGANKYLQLESTTSVATDTGIWNNTAPTSSVLSLGNAGYFNNASGGTYVCYAFAGKQGYSKFGSYTGNGSTDGVFVYLGFSPSFIIAKRTDSTANWYMMTRKISDSGGGNPLDRPLFANDSQAENDGDNNVDFLSNGFKLRGSGSAQNGSGATYIYMAFAEHPFVTAGTKAAGTAR